jgi:hypothetical protein
MITSAPIENLSPAAQQAPALPASPVGHPATGDRLAALRAYLRANPALPPRPPLPVSARVLRSGRPVLAVVPARDVAA